MAGNSSWAGAVCAFDSKEPNPFPLQRIGLFSVNGKTQAVRKGIRVTLFLGGLHGYFYIREDNWQKKVGNFMEYGEMASFENLYNAHRAARKGKRDQKEVIEFELDLAWNLQKLRGELMSGRYRPKPYKQFRIYDPKERVIYALQYRDRVVQHTLCDNVIQPYMERHLIYDNAASRVGKGTHFAMDRLTYVLSEIWNRRILFKV